MRTPSDRATGLLSAIAAATVALAAPRGAAAAEAFTPVAAHAVASVPLWQSAAGAAAAEAGDEPPAPRPGMLFRGDAVRIVGADAGAVEVEAGAFRGFVRRAFLWPGSGTIVATTRSGAELLEGPGAGAAVVGRTPAGAILLVVGEEGRYRRVDHAGRRIAWARAADLTTDEREVEGARLLERGRACAARGRAAEAAEAYWSAVGAAAGAPILEELSRLAGLGAPAPPPEAAAGPPLAFGAGEVAAEAHRRASPSRRERVLTRLETGLAEGVDWEQLARRHFKAFPLDAPAPRELLEPPGELFYGPSFGFAAPLAAGHRAGRWYAAAAGGIAAMEPVQLSGSVFVATDAEPREVSRSFEGRLLLTGSLPANAGSVVVIRTPAAARFAVRDVLYGGALATPTPGERVTLDAAGGDRVRAFLASSPKRAKLAYLFEVLPGGARYLYVSWATGQACESQDELYQLGDDLTPAFTLDYDCDV